MRILISGGTGFIGSALVRALGERGDSITVLTRRIPEAQAVSDARAASDTRAASNAMAMPDALRGVPGVRWAHWDPKSDGPWQAELAEHDAVLHLAGETAAGRRYTEASKREILESRVASTQRLVRGIERAERRPAVFVSASGVGFYGDRPDGVLLDESAAAGQDFLAQVCVAWENAAREVERLGVRSVSGRIGFVLGRKGGALARMVPIFKAGVGGPLGSGRQMVSWIHLDDVVGAFVKALDDDTLSGPMNVTAPGPVSNKELTRTLGRVLGRPALLPAPAFALRALFGEGAEPLLTGQAVVPRALMEHGYVHRFTDLEAALQDVLNG